MPCEYLKEGRCAAIVPEEPMFIGQTWMSQKCLTNGECPYKRARKSKDSKERKIRREEV